MAFCGSELGNVKIKERRNVNKCLDRIYMDNKTNEAPAISVTIEYSISLCNFTFKKKNTVNKPVGIDCIEEKCIAYMSKSAIAILPTNND